MKANLFPITEKMSVVNTHSRPQVGGWKITKVLLVNIFKMQNEKKTVSLIASNILFNLLVPPQSFNQSPNNIQLIGSCIVVL